jgi:hypothetical protein
MYIRSLGIRDLRAVARGQLDLLYPKREQDKTFAQMRSWPPRLDNVNPLLGMNGAGKSTILDAAALVVLSPIIAQSGYRPYYLIRRIDRKRRADKALINAELVIHEQDGVRPKSRGMSAYAVETIIEQRGDIERVRGADEDNPIWEGMFSDSSPAFLLVGYGATRRVESTFSPDSASRSKWRHLRYERVASLFEDFTLRPLASWPPRWKSRNPGRFKQVVDLINKLSREGVRFTGEIENNEYISSRSEKPRCPSARSRTAIRRSSAGSEFCFITSAWAVRLARSSSTIVVSCLSMRSIFTSIRSGNRRSFQPWPKLFRTCNSSSRRTVR